jgi:hypothetical protein
MVVDGQMSYTLLALNDAIAACTTDRSRPSSSDPPVPYQPLQLFTDEPAAITHSQLVTVLQAVTTSLVSCQQRRDTDDNTIDRLQQLNAQLIVHSHALRPRRARPLAAPGNDEFHQGPDIVSGQLRTTLRCCSIMNLVLVSGAIPTHTCTGRHATDWCTRPRGVRDQSSVIFSPAATPINDLLIVIRCHSTSRYIDPVELVDWDSNTVPWLESSPTPAPRLVLPVYPL